MSRFWKEVRVRCTSVLERRTSAILKRARQNEVGGPWTDLCQGNIQHLSTGSRVSRAESSDRSRSANKLFLFPPRCPFSLHPGLPRNGRASTTSVRHDAALWPKASLCVFRIVRSVFRGERRRLGVEDRNADSEGLETRAKRTNYELGSLETFFKRIFRCGIFKLLFSLFKKEIFRIGR